MSHSEISPVLHCVGWGGKRIEMPADFVMGVGRMRKYPKRGIRRAAFDIAYGYASGFRKRDILYYVITHCFSDRLSRMHLDRAKARIQAEGSFVDVVLPALREDREAKFEQHVESFVQLRLSEGYDIRAMVERYEETFSARR